MKVRAFHVRLASAAAAVVGITLACAATAAPRPLVLATTSNGGVLDVYPQHMMTCTSWPLHQVNGDATTTWTATATPTTVTDVGSFSPTGGAGVTYTAPAHAVANETITITARTGAGTTSVDVPVATAFPVLAPATSFGGADNVQSLSLPAFQHLVAASQNVAYVVWAELGNLGSVKLAVSKDYGRTWSSPITIASNSAALGDATNPSVAVDAGDPTTAYVAFMTKSTQSYYKLTEVTVTQATSSAPQVSPLRPIITGPAIPMWPVVASPAPGTVVIASQNRSSTDPGVFVLRDPHGGANFPNLAPSPTGDWSNVTSGRGSFAVNCTGTDCATWEAFDFPAVQSAPYRATCAVPISSCDPSQCAADHGMCVPQGAAAKTLTFVGQETQLVAAPAGTGSRLCLSTVMRGASTSSTVDSRFLVTCNDQTGAIGGWAPYQVVAWSAYGQPAVDGGVLAVAPNGGLAAAWLAGSASLHVGWSSNVNAGPFGDLTVATPKAGTAGANLDLQYGADGMPWLTYDWAGVPVVDRACDPGAQAWSGPVPISTTTTQDSRAALMLGRVDDNGVHAWPMAVTTLAHHAVGTGTYEGYDFHPFSTIE